MYEDFFKLIVFYFFEDMEKIIIEYLLKKSMEDDQEQEEQDLIEKLKINKETVRVALKWLELGRLVETFEQANTTTVTLDGVKHRKLKFWRLNNSVVEEIKEILDPLDN